MMKHGDFTGLADDYAKFRPGYAVSVADALVGYVRKPITTVDAADIGAGTGIWTRALADRRPHSLVAVEPNDDMRGQGVASSQGVAIAWRKGTAEQTGLPSHSYDMVTMASSFHWADFDQACAEFQRILRPGGVFAALWNPRLIEVNPLLVEIEVEITRLKPDVRRVSSGRSGLTERLTDLLRMRADFTDVLYLESRHTISQTPAQYMGAWRSVNDLQVQLGAHLFQEFMQFVERRTSGLPAIETTYLTRAWATRRI